MSYTKPQVVIDLEEYNELKKQAQAADSNEQVIMAKQVVFEMLENRDVHIAVKKLQDKGIRIYIPNGDASKVFTVDKIVIERF